MTEAGWTVCIECGMMCEAVEYHPYAACLMFKQCLNSETVRANLQAVRDDSYQQGRVAGLVRGAQLVRWHKSCAFEADPALALERAAKDIESVASQIIQPQQAAQDEKGVGNANIKMS